MHMHIYIYTYISARTHTHMYAVSYYHIPSDGLFDICMYIYMCVCIHTYTRTHTHALSCSFTHRIPSDGLFAGSRLLGSLLTQSNMLYQR